MLAGTSRHQDPCKSILDELEGSAYSHAVSGDNYALSLAHKKVCMQTHICLSAGNQIQLLSTPTEFLNAVLVRSCPSYADLQQRFLMSGDSVQGGITSAQHHLTVASLYIGTADGLEADFVDALAAAARAAERPDLKVHVLLDALRATRPSISTTGACEAMHSFDGSSHAAAMRRSFQYSVCWVNSCAMALFRML